MAYYEQQKNGQLCILFNNFKVRYKGIYQKDEMYLKLKKQIEENNKSYYDKTSDQVFFVNGQFDNSVFEYAFDLVNNYEKIKNQKLLELQKAHNAIFRRKRKVAECKQSLNKLDQEFNKFFNSIAKYKKFVKVWHKNGFFVNINSELEYYQKKLFKDLLGFYFDDVVKETPEILLAKQTEISFEDDTIAEFLLKQRKNYNMKKIEEDFDIKYKNLINKSNQNPSQEF